jgi:hypothetical protein
LKTKLPITGFILFLILAALCVPAYLAKQYRGLLLALPKDIGSPGIDVFNAQEFSKSEFLLTYEIPHSDRVSLSNGQFPVTLIGTNSSYPQFFGYSMAEGSFFSNQSWTGKIKHAVFNEEAAFKIFGSGNIAGNRFKIRGDTWLVTGVINDDCEDQSRIYIPSSVHGGKAASLVMTVSNTMDEIYMKNSLKTLGVRERDFEFINFNAYISFLWERAAVLLFGFFGLFFLSLLRPLIAALKKAMEAFKSELDHSYPAEVFQNNKKLIGANALPALGIMILSVIVLILFIKIISICLPWQDIPAINRNYFTFYRHLEEIYILELVSRALFILTIGIIGFFFYVLNLTTKKSS